VKTRSLTPWLVALACFGPFLLAYALYFGPWGETFLRPLEGSRELLTEAVPVPAQWREGGNRPWELTYARLTPCELDCAADLGRLLQVQLALAGDQELVQRGVWHVGELPPLADPDLRAARLDSPEGQALVAALGPERIGDGRVFVIDPLGNVILSYPKEVEQKELLRDLKRLLRGSH
jgi:hypothetical protein